MMHHATSASQSSIRKIPFTEFVSKVNEGLRLYVEQLAKSHASDSCNHIRRIRAFIKDAETESREQFLVMMKRTVIPKRRCSCVMQRLIHEQPDKPIYEADRRMVRRQMMGILTPREQVYLFDLQKGNSNDQKNEASSSRLMSRTQRHNQIK